MTNNLPITDMAAVQKTIRHRSELDASWAYKQRMEDFKACAKSISPWLHRLYDAYMERGQFPLLPNLMADYYDNPDDKVIATIVGCLCVTAYLNDNSMMSEIDRLRRLMGAHPYKDFFKGRKYVLLSLGEEQDKQIGGFGSMRYWQVARIVNSLYETEAQYDKVSLGHILMHKIVFEDTDPTDALASMLDKEFVVRDRLNLILTALCTDYGIGIGLWHFKGVESRLNAPMEKKVEGFLNLIYPYYKSYGFTAHEIGTALGFDNDIDLWYLYNAYMELVKVNRTAISKYMRRWRTQLRHKRSDGNNRQQLKLIEPEILF